MCQVKKKKKILFSILGVIVFVILAIPLHYLIINFYRNYVLAYIDINATIVPIIEAAYSFFMVLSLKLLLDRFDVMQLFFFNLAFILIVPLSTTTFYYFIYHSYSLINIEFVVVYFYYFSFYTVIAILSTVLYLIFKKIFYY